MHYPYSKNLRNIFFEELKWQYIHIKVGKGLYAQIRNNCFKAHHQLSRLREKTPAGHVIIPWMWVESIYTFPKCL